MSAATAPGVQLPAGRRVGARSSPTGTSSVLRAMASDRRPDSKFTLPLAPPPGVHTHSLPFAPVLFYDVRPGALAPGGGRNATRRTYNAYGSRFAVAVPRTICLRVIVRGQRASSTMTTQ